MKRIEYPLFNTLVDNFVDKNITKTIQLFNCKDYQLGNIYMRSIYSQRGLNN